MTSPESPAVQDTDRLREVAAEAEALRRGGPASDGRGWYRTAADRVECFAIADAVLAAVLPVHREMVLRGAADYLDPGHRDPIPEGEMTSADWVRAAQRGAASNLRMWASPAFTHMWPPTPPGSPPADERATAVETGRGGACCASAAESDGHCHEPGCLYLLGLQTGRAERDIAVREADRLREQVEAERDALRYEREVLGFASKRLRHDRDRLAETIRRVRALHSPEPGWEREWRDPTQAPCAGCTTSASTRFIDGCQTLAALGDIPSPAAPEAATPWPGLPTPGLHLVDPKYMNRCLKCGKLAGPWTCPGAPAEPEGTTQ